MLAVKSCKRFKDKLRRLTRKGGRSLSQRMVMLNRYLQGWKNYFKEAESPEVFQSLDSWIRRRLRSLTVVPVENIFQTLCGAEETRNQEGFSKKDGGIK